MRLQPFRLFGFKRKVDRRDPDFFLTIYPIRRIIPSIAMTVRSMRKARSSSKAPMLPADGRVRENRNRMDGRSHRARQV